MNKKENQIQRKKDFHARRKKDFTEKYHKLKSEFNQEECFEKIAEENNLSPDTVRQIIFNSNYLQKPTKAA